MKRSITRWTTTLATAALLGLPVAATAKPQQPSTPPQQQQPAPQPAQPQQPQPQPTEPQPAQPQPAQPQPTQPPAQPQPTEPQPTQPPAQPQPTQPQPTEPQPTAPPTSTTQQPTASAPSQSVSPEEHLRQARAAFSDIKMASIPARDRAQFAELRRHLSALENPAASARSSRGTARRGAQGSTTSASGSESWGTEVAAIDRIITNLAGSDTAATGTSGTGTSGAAGTTGASRTRGSSMTAVDDATRAKLMEIRTHITAYAAAKSGASSSSPRSDASATMANQTTTSAAQSGNATAGETPRTGNYPASGTAAGQPPAATPNSAAGQQPPTSTPDATTAGQAGQTNPAGTVKVDAEAAHRSLLAARDALNQLTQLPAAAQLTGESRTQIQQLITNFNELITNSSDWRASYTKVAGTLTALLGPDNTDAEATAGAPTTATGAAGTAGAVGTGGGATVQLDPAVRAKLVEMRNNLNEFQKASGGINK